MGDIFNPKLSGNINAKNKYKKAVQSHSYSKSDDETFGSLDESKDENVSTKSDGEQNKKEKQKQNEKKSKTEKEEKEHKEIDVEDVREIFLRNIHNAARRNKEKEIEAHVEAFKKEMRLNHYNNRYKFGPYDEDDKYWHNRSPSKQSNSSSLSNEDKLSNSNKSPSKQSTDKSPKEKEIKSPTEKEKNHQILNVLNTLNLPKLHRNHQVNKSPTNYHKNVFNIDPNKSNYGKHLKLILNSCRIQKRGN